jgi:hypothetical protein
LQRSARHAIVYVGSAGAGIFGATFRPPSVAICLTRRGAITMGKVSRRGAA